VLIACLAPLWFDATRLAAARAGGDFAFAEQPPNDWTALQDLFRFVRANTPPGAVLVANMDELCYLDTGRKTIRGFAPSGFDLFYAPRPEAVTPDKLAGAIIAAQAGYVLLTPDRDLPESAAFHKSVAALERGGVIEPVSVPGESRDYRLLRVTR